MELTMIRQRNPDAIATGDGFIVEGHGECMVVAILDAAEGLFQVMSFGGDLLVLKYNHAPVTMPASTTLQ